MSYGKFHFDSDKIWFQLSTLAIQDYNRARTYLIDIATKLNVPVFDDINKAVMYCTEKCISTQKLLTY